MHNGIQWDTLENSFLTPNDVLLTQGFPTRSSMSMDAPCCSFALDRSHSLNATTGQAGNSMNIHIAGVMLMYGIMFCTRSDDIPLEDMVSIGVIASPNAWSAYLASSEVQPCHP
jgi:hypothetical protein